MNTQTEKYCSYCSYNSQILKDSGVDESEFSYCDDCQYLDCFESSKIYKTKDSKKAKKNKSLLKDLLKDFVFDKTTKYSDKEANIRTTKKLKNSIQLNINLAILREMSISKKKSDKSKIDDLSDDIKKNIKRAFKSDSFEDKRLLELFSRDSIEDIHQLDNLVDFKILSKIQYIRNELDIRSADKILKFIKLSNDNSEYISEIDSFYSDLKYLERHDLHKMIAIIEDIELNGILYNKVYKKRKN